MELGLPTPSSSSSKPSSRGQSFEDALRIETLTTEAPNNAVKAEALTVYLGGRCLLRNTELTIAEQSRLVEVPTEAGKTKTVRRGTCYGLVGPNGCGKSTLLRLFAESHLPTPASWEVFLVGQHLPASVDRSAVEEVLAADTGRAELMELQLQLEARLAAQAEEGGFDASDCLDVGRQLEEAQVQLGRWEGAADEVAKILVALGFARPGAGAVGVPAVDSSMQHLSGGWRMKVELAKALWLKPKLLLLDEPTNHLDFEALQWLEDQLDEYPHTSVVVSHDVAFLHSVCREIFWVKDCQIESMPRDVVSQEALASMQRSKPLSFKFAVADAEGAPETHGVSVHQAEFSYDGSRAKGLRVGNIRFSGCSRAVLLGKNGSGKSTFLGLCTRQLEPSRGSVDHTHGCRVGYYSQQMDDIDRCAELTAAEFLIETRRDELDSRLDVKARAAERAAERRGAKSASAAAATKKRLAEVARGVLSGFGFEGDLAVSVPVGRLSGGQKARLKLAALALRPAHILFMDEPTNHLDAEAKEALAHGLSEFKGGIVVVTHDDLLIYRLIQCNWSQSELLTCHGGWVQCKKDFGGHCLKSLKAEMRKSEVAGLFEKKGRTLSPEKTVKKERSGPVTCPPWLAGSRRTRPAAAEKVQAPCDVPAEDKKDVLAPVEKAKAKLLRNDLFSAPRLLPQDLAQVASPARLRNQRLPVAPEPAALAPQPSAWPALPVVARPAAPPVATISLIAPMVHVAVPAAEVPDRWDDDEDDDGTVEGLGVLVSPASSSPEAPASPSMGHSEEASPVQASPAKPPAPQHAEEAAEAKAGGGSHSRFRKDLVNLNKGVAKWLVQEAAGLLTVAQVEERVRQSAAARHLATTRREAFEEEIFVREAITRGRAVAERKRA